MALQGIMSRRISNVEENPKIFTIEKSRLHKSFLLAKAINTANEGETIILSIYRPTNRFDGTVCIEVLLRFEIA